MKKASAGQIVEIVAQLGSGRIDGDRAQSIIENRLETPSGDSVREAQARVLYDKFGGVLGCTTFDQYLDADGKDSFEPVPQLPVWPANHVRLFGRESVCLVDRRVVKQVGLKEYCRLAGLAYDGEDNTFEPFDPKQIKEQDIYWMLFQDGYRNRNRKPNDCREGFQPFEVGMSEVEGVSVYVQNPAVIDDHVMDLPGSVHREARDDVALFGRFGGGPELLWYWGGGADPHCGTASRAE